MTCFQQHRHSEPLCQLASSFGQRLLVGELLSAKQYLSFRDIGSDHTSQGYQFATQSIDGFFLNQSVSACRNHHRVEHHIPDSVLPDLPGDATDNLGRLQHSDLHGISPDVAKHSLDLSFDYRHRYGMHAFHTQGVLHSNSRDSTGCIAPQCRYCLNISLNASTASAVTSCDGQNSVILSHRHLFIVVNIQNIWCLLN